MLRRHKTYELANFKALDESEGTFEAIVSVFGNVDLVGDRVVKGAFEKSLKEWDESDKQIPVIFSHRWDDLDAHIGGVVKAEERDEGLWVKGQLDLEEDSSRKAFKLMKRGTLSEFSFAYDIVREKTADDGANELLELKIIEVGPTLKGANPETQLLGVKSRKAMGMVEGSAEERRELINRAARARWGGDEAWVWVIATFDERAIVSVETQESSTYYEVSYTLSDEGVTLGEGREVELETEVVVKSRGLYGMKAGRVLSSKNEGKLRQASGLISEVLAALPDVEDEPKGVTAPAPVKTEGSIPRDPRFLRLVTQMAADTPPKEQSA